jgi:glycerol-1-phosphate dehydrogenase [NAD(P)+]
MIDPIYIGKDAVSKLLEYTVSANLKHLAIIADTNTYKALGQRVEEALKSKGHDVTTIVLKGDHVHADEHQLVQVLLQAPREARTFIAVGSGTITDITRFVSYHTNRPFIAMPTAPSVDGFTSVGAPVILAGVKTTIICQVPLAMFADIDTLCNAPQRLIAAGFGDMIGKITSLADWKLGNLLWNEPYDKAIAKRSQAAIDQVTANSSAIAKRSEEGVKTLMDALVESGLCMSDFGSSRPASGAEHHASHFWEMTRLKQGRESALHGEQVGYALSVVAGMYTRLRDVSQAEVAKKLESTSLPKHDEELATIRTGYGEMAEAVAKDQAAFLGMSQEDFTRLKETIIKNWSTIQEIATQVPNPEVIIKLLGEVGAPSSYEALGLIQSEMQAGFAYGHFLRNRFTVTKLSRILGLPLTSEEAKVTALA